MKRGWILVLLISLGLNLGLGYRLWSERGRADDRPFHGKDGLRAGGRPSAGDSTGWQQRLDRRRQRMAERLGLDPDQREAFERFHDEAMRQVFAGRRELDASRERLQGLLGAAVIEPDSVRAAFARLSLRQASLDSLMAEKMLEEMSLLRPDQRARYLELLKREMESGFGPAGGPGRRGGGRHGGGTRGAQADPPPAD